MTQAGLMLLLIVVHGVVAYAAAETGPEPEINVGFAAAVVPTAVDSVGKVAVPWTAEERARAAPAPAWAGIAVDQWAAQNGNEPWSAYTQPAAAGMTATTSAEPSGNYTARAARHRKGQFAVKVPRGARNLHLQLQSHDDFVFGTAYNPETAGIGDDMSWYNLITSSLFTGLTPENRFKWFEYEQHPGDFAPARDMLVNRYIRFAQQNGYKLARGHTLEWYKTDGFWAHQLNCTDYVAALKQRVTRDVAYFKGKFQQYDVFNELVDIPGMLDKCNLWDTAFPDAFKWAHAIDPDARLCINDYSLIEAGNAPKLMKIIRDHLLRNNAPIHCIGIQAHFEHYGINITHQKQQLDLLATMGLDLYITEFTLFTTWLGPPILPDHPEGWPVSYLDEKTAADSMVNLFKFWFSHPAIKGVFMWGFWDKNIWIPNSGIYTVDKKPKKAAAAVQAWLNTIRTEVVIDEPASWTEFKGYYGTYNYSYEARSGEVQRGVVRFSKDSEGRRQDLRSVARS